MSKSRIQPARDSRLAIVPAPSIAMSAITTPKPRANAIRTLIFTQLRFGRAPLERDVACDDDNRHDGCTDARCDESGAQPAKPREGCQQEQRVVRMEALHPVPCLDSGRAELFEHLRTPDAKQHRTAAEQPEGHGRVAEPAVAQPDPGAEKPETVEDHVRIVVEYLAARAAHVTQPCKFAIGPVKHAGHYPKD